MERGHPVRQRAQRALPSVSIHDEAWVDAQSYALHAQCGQDVRAPTDSFDLTNYFDFL